MKDSQPFLRAIPGDDKYIKESNERFSTLKGTISQIVISISRRVMKDSQHVLGRRF